MTSRSQETEMVEQAQAVIDRLKNIADALGSTNLIRARQIHDELRILESAIRRATLRPDAQTAQPEAHLYRLRCGWCGAYEGAVPNNSPCDGAMACDVGDKHEFKRFERLYPPAVQPSSDEGEVAAFTAHLVEVGRPVQIAREAVINRAKEIKPSQMHDVGPTDGPLMGLIRAVNELRRQEAIAKAAPKFRAHLAAPKEGA